MELEDQPDYQTSRSDEDIPDVNEFQNFKEIIGRSTEAGSLSWVWKAMEYLQFGYGAHCQQILEFIVSKLRCI